MKEIKEQISLFDGSHPLEITKPVRLIELFAGIGSQAKALKNLNVGFEHYRVCEFDKYAIKSYNAIHDTEFKVSDITQLKGSDLGICDTDKYEYIMTYSFPCTDLSIAGKQAGMSKGSGTRSGLLWEVERLLNETDKLPQILLMENVPQVICSDFFDWCNFLETLGYKNYYDLLNAKNYGIPQNRERCFMVSCLGDLYYDFPKAIPLELRLKDMLETDVDEKYYLSDKDYEYAKKREGKYTQLLNYDSDIAPSAITAVGNQNWTGNFIECDCVGNLSGGKWDKTHESSGRVYSSNGLSPTIHTCGGGNQEIKICEPFIVASRGRNPDNPSDRTAGTHCKQRLEPNIQGLCNTLTTVQKDNYVCEQNYLIRKLTPKEYYRLMGFSDEDFSRAEKVNSNTQLYKQAGNSIVVNVLMEIFKQMI